VRYSPDEIEAVLAETTCHGKVAGHLLGLSSGATYEALRRGEIPSIRIGRTFRVPTAKLREMLGLPDQTRKAG